VRNQVVQPANVFLPMLAEQHLVLHVAVLCEAICASLPARLDGSFLSLLFAAHQVALVGKGLTFDSGGYNLKVHGGIETMKCDMGGAGAVLGAARAIQDLKPDDVEVRQP